MTKSIDFGFFMKYRKLQCLNLLSSKWKTKHSLFWRKEIALFSFFLLTWMSYSIFYFFYFCIRKWNKLGLSWAKLSHSWGLKFRLKFQVSVRGLKLKFEVKFWGWSIKLKFEIWSWFLKLKFEFYFWIWSLESKFEIAI